MGCALTGKLALDVYTPPYQGQRRWHAERIEQLERVWIEKQLVELQEQITVLCAEAASTQQEPIKVMVVGGLQDLGGLHEATRWLDDTIAKMNGPKHVGTYTKSNAWRGLFWVKSPSTADKDMMVALIRSVIV